MEMIHKPQDRGHLLAAVDTVMNLQLPYNTGNFLIK